MIKKIWTFCVTLMVFAMAFMSTGTGVSAQQDATTPLGVAASEPDYAEGQNNFTTNAAHLILSGDISIFLESNRQIRIVAKTAATDIMDKVGFKDMTIQRWVNGAWVSVHTWDAFKENSMMYLFDYTTTVAGGYSYRVTCKHYAEKGWWLFTDTEEVYNETSFLWVG